MVETRTRGCGETGRCGASSLEPSRIGPSSLLAHCVSRFIRSLGHLGRLLSVVQLCMYAGDVDRFPSIPQVISSIVAASFDTHDKFTTPPYIVPMFVVCFLHDL